MTSAPEREAPQRLRNPARIIIPVGLDPLILDDRHAWRVYLPGTGKVIGRVEPVGRKWRAAASMFAFLGDGPDDGADYRGDWVPRALYMPLWDSERHHYLPGTYASQEAAVAALRRYLDEHQAPAMGHGAHPDVQHRKA